MKKSVIRHRLYKMIVLECKRIFSVKNEFSLQEDSINDSLADILYYLEFIDDKTIKDFLSDKILKAKFEYAKNKKSSVIGGFLDIFETYVEPIILVDFIISRVCHWPVCRELINVFLKDNRCFTRIIPTPFVEDVDDKYGKQLQLDILSENYSYIDFNEYNIENEIPDIVIIDMPYDMDKIKDFKFFRIHNLVDRIVYLEYAIKYGIRKTLFPFAEGLVKSWQFIIPSINYVNAYKYCYRADGEFIHEGFPEVDLVLKLPKPNNEHRTVLWSIPNTVNNEEFEELCFWIENAVQEYPDIYTCVRFHPGYNNHRGGIAHINKIKELVKDYNNLMIDNSSSIYSAYSKSDGFITTEGSSTLISWLPTGRPVMAFPATIKAPADIFSDMYFLRALYCAFNVDSIRTFYNDIRNNTDSLKNIREKVAEEYLGKFDGNAGMRIKDEIVRRFYLEENNE